jgi:hypothetical protein
MAMGLVNSVSAVLIVMIVAHPLIQVQRNNVAMGLTTIATAPPKKGAAATKGNPFHAIQARMVPQVLGDAAQVSKPAATGISVPVRHLGCPWERSVMATMMTVMARSMKASPMRAVSVVTYRAKPVIYEITTAMGPSTKAS